jgi:hypothetical protein
VPIRVIGGGIKNFFSYRVIECGKQAQQRIARMHTKKYPTDFAMKNALFEQITKHSYPFV